MKKIKKKFFESSTSDRGIHVKFQKSKVVFSFWGNDEPRNISFTKEDALDMTNSILEHFTETGEQQSGDIFLEEFDKIKGRLPKHGL